MKNNYIERDARLREDARSTDTHISIKAVLCIFCMVIIYLELFIG